MRLVAGVLLFLTPALVMAQDEEARARTVFQQGLEHASAERWVAAEASFAEALELRWTGPIAYNLAYSRSELGRFVDAVRLCDQIIHRDDVAEDVKTATRELREQASPRIGTVTVRVEGDTEDLELTLDGRAIPMAQPVAVDPGIYRVVARRDGMVVGRAEQTVREGEATTVELTDLAPRAPREEPEVRVVVVPGEPTEQEKSRVGVIVGVIVGVLVAGAAVGLGVGLTRDDTVLPSGSLGTVDSR